ncbi:MAG: EF-P beta-lysylation protein EpmB [Pseudomonadota bacterium]
MITPDTPVLKLSWQQELARAISDPAQLLERLDLDLALLPAAQAAAAQFPLRVTEHYLNLIQPGKPQDPLLRQILPLAEELTPTPGYHTDPVGDTHASSGTGLLHKYQGRALLITTGACAIHCRYCFRRHYPYQADNALRHWQAMLQQLATQPELSEVILSGGDPLCLSDERLDALITEIETVPHIQRLRLHSRLPLVLPNRLTDTLIDRLQHSRLHASLVLHSNHPAELTPELMPGLRALRQAEVTLLNQSVLLAGVNDQIAVLKQLSETLFAYGILPYYLHVLDPVQGAAHFAVSDTLIPKIETGLRAQLPGYLVPRIVREIAGAPAKLPAV